MEPKWVKMTLDEFRREHCVGAMYDSCVSSPCLYASRSGCAHPLHPKHQPPADPEAGPGTEKKRGT